MVALMDTTLDAVHRISTELRPGVLHELGLEAAVDWYIQEFQKRSEIVCRLRSGLNGTEVDNQRSTAAFRIFQEILTNVARHAAATEVEVFLGTEKGDLVLEASDNGRGIPEERISDSRSLGLLGMRERARSFGGNVAIRGAAGGGTTVSVRIPL
jgi:signal transduction histidine kinase